LTMTHDRWNKWEAATETEIWIEKERERESRQFDSDRWRLGATTQ